MADIVSTQKVEKHKYTSYLTKATEYIDDAKNALERKHWNGAVLSAVHCTISSCDALTVFYIGKKHKGIKHSDAARLLSTVNDIPLSELKDKTNQFISVLDFKTPVEYGDRVFNSDEAHRVVKQADRFHSWVKQKLPL